jgi:hydroxymethylbilane synthase
MIFPHAEFTEIRGNVDTRLRKIAEGGVADATLLAVAGLNRLRIGNWPGVEFHALGFESMVPAVGQAAIGVQCRAREVEKFAGVFDAATARTVTLERAFQSALGGGCHTAFAAHATADTLYFFHHEVGLRSLPLGDGDFAQPVEYARQTLKYFGFNV